jgi:drug/metabolite transporter (DMT)-like permease
LAVALAFLSSIGFGIVDFIGGVKSRRLGVPVVLTLSHLTALVLVLLTLGVVASSAPSAAALVLSFLSGAVVIVGIAAYYRALETAAMGVVAPIIATAPVIPLAVGVLLGEDLTPAQALGIALALGGVAATAYQPGPSAKGSRIALGVGLGAFGALAVGVYYVMIDFAADQAPLVWVVFLHRVGIVAAIMLVIYPYLRRRRIGAASPSGGARANRRDVALLVAMGVISASSTFLLAHALSLGLLSIVSVIAALFPVTTIVLARLLLNERISSVQRAGAVVALTGVAIVSA